MGLKITAGYRQAVECGGGVSGLTPRLRTLGQAAFQSCPLLTPQLGDSVYTSTACGHTLGMQVVLAVLFCDR